MRHKGSPVFSNFKNTTKSSVKEKQENIACFCCTWCNKKKKQLPDIKLPIDINTMDQIILGDVLRGVEKSLHKWTLSICFTCEFDKVLRV